MIGSQTPRLHVAPAAVDATYGDLAGSLAGDYGLAPDAWQRLILTDWLAVTGGRWASLSCGLSVPRQNGKNVVLEIRELFGMVGRGEKILHTAHQVKTAQKHFRRLRHFFGSKVNDPAAVYPELNALVAEMRLVNGQEAIYLHNGGSVELVARSKGSGRGYTVDVMVCDEAQDLSDEDLEALMPATSAAPSGDPQWIFAGTPPSPSTNGEVFTRSRIEALSANPDRLCWHEWSAASDDDIDLDDRDLWAATNPGLGLRLQLSVVEGERRKFSGGGFARERLGLWSPEHQTGVVIDPATWAALASGGPDGHVAPDALAVDASHDRIVAIAGCWATDGGTHVEAVALDQVPDSIVAADWLVANAGRRIPIVVDAASPAASLVPTLQARGCRVIQTNAPDMGKACGLFYDDVLAGRLTHGGQHQVDAALGGARRRAIRDAGGWGWDRSSPAVNIAPLVAVTLARFGVATTKPRRMRGSNGRTISNRKAVLL